MAKKWTYHTGDKGRNRVRAFVEAKSGKIYLEFFALKDGKRRRIRRSTGHTDRKEARQQAQEMAAKIGRSMTQKEEPNELTLRKLFDIYLGEKTPEKSEGKQKHDRRAAEMFVGYYGRDRKPESLKKRDGERFIKDRLDGSITGLQAVGNRTVEYDLRFLLAVLNWAADNDLLTKNPLKSLKLPKEKNPARPIMSKAEYQRMRDSAGKIGWRFKLALVLAYETGHRSKAIRRLRWSDVDFEAPAIRWRAENDKSGQEHTTPLTAVAVEALQEAQREQLSIGDAWVLPSPQDASQNCSRHLLRDWWQRGIEAASLDDVKGRGWHSLRRLFATRMKDQPMVTLLNLGGWRDQETVVKCYQTADFEEMKRALAAG